MLADRLSVDCFLNRPLLARSFRYAALPLLILVSVLISGPDAEAQANFGSINVGTTSAAQTLTLTFNASVTLASTPYAVLTEGVAGLDFEPAGTQAGTVCVAGQSYVSGNTCTVDVTFAPSLSGSRNGAVVLYSSSNTVVATAFAVGTGVAPQLNFLPAVRSTVSASGISKPSGVAADGGGNLYVVDRSNKIFKETLQANGSCTQSQITSITGLNNPFGVSIDGAGNLYIADSFNNRILKETLQPTGTYTQTVVASGFNNPADAAVDLSGNVYFGVRSGETVIK